MSQKERDRLKVRTEAKDELLTQKQAAGQLKLSERQVRRLVQRLRQVGHSCSRFPNRFARITTAAAGASGCKASISKTRNQSGNSRAKGIWSAGPTPPGDLRA